MADKKTIFVTNIRYMEEKTGNNT